MVQVVLLDNMYGCDSENAWRTQQKAGFIFSTLFITLTTFFACRYSIYSVIPASLIYAGILYVITRTLTYPFLETREIEKAEVEVKEGVDNSLVSSWNWTAIAVTVPVILIVFSAGIIHELGSYSGEINPVSTCEIIITGVTYGVVAVFADWVARISFLFDVPAKFLTSSAYPIEFAASSLEPWIASVSCNAFVYNHSTGANSQING